MFGYAAVSRNDGETNKGVKDSLLDQLVLVGRSCKDTLHLGDPPSGLLFCMKEVLLLERRLRIALGEVTSKA